MSVALAKDQLLEDNYWQAEQGFVHYNRKLILFIEGLVCARHSAGYLAYIISDLILTTML